MSRLTNPPSSSPQKAKASPFETSDPLPPRKPTKRMKNEQRTPKNESSAVLQKSEKSNSDSVPESSSGDDYRSLRRKYLLLEEENFSMETDILELEDEIKNLEDEKHALLDELVVLEGLISPSELGQHEARL